MIELARRMSCVQASAIRVGDPLIVGVGFQGWQGFVVGLPICCGKHNQAMQ